MNTEETTQNDTTSTNVTTLQQDSTTSPEKNTTIQYSSSETTKPGGEENKPKKKKIEQYFPVQNTVKTQPRTPTNAGKPKTKNKITTTSKNKELEKMKSFMRKYSSPKTADQSLPSPARDGSTNTDSSLRESQMRSAWRESSESYKLAVSTNLVWGDTEVGQEKLD